MVAFFLKYPVLQDKKIWFIDKKKKKNCWLQEVKKKKKKKKKNLGRYPECTCVCVYVCMYTSPG